MEFSLSYISGGQVGEISLADLMIKISVHLDDFRHRLCNRFPLSDRFCYL